LHDIQIFRVSPVYSVNILVFIAISPNGNLKTHIVLQWTTNGRNAVVFVLQDHDRSTELV